MQREKLPVSFISRYPGIYFIASLLKGDLRNPAGLMLQSVYGRMTAEG